MKIRPYLRLGGQIIPSITFTQQTYQWPKPISDYLVKISNIVTYGTKSFEDGETYWSAWNWKNYGFEGQSITAFISLVNSEWINSQPNKIIEKLKNDKKSPFRRVKREN